MGFKKKQMDRREGSFLHLHSMGYLEDARACLYCLFLRRSKYLRFFHPYISELRMTVHLFGAVSSPSCACFAQRKTAEDNQHSIDLEVIDTVYNCDGADET